MRAMAPAALPPRRSSLAAVVATPRLPSPRYAVATVRRPRCQRRFICHIRMPLRRNCCSILESAALVRPPSRANTPRRRQRQPSTPMPAATPPRRRYDGARHRFTAVPPNATTLSPVAGSSRCRLASQRTKLFTRRIAVQMYSRQR